MAGRIVHVVMGSGIVLGAYWRADLAMQHARCITGTTVASLDLDAVPATLRAMLAAEILDALPPEICADIQASEWETEDEFTPEVTFEIDFDEIEDKNKS